VLTEARLLRSKLLGFLLIAGALLGSASVPEVRGEGPDSPQDAPQVAAPAIAPAPEPEPPPTRTVGDVVRSGVVITVSLSSQRMHVFRDGVLWKSSPVSTGKRGKRTPTGVFAILQKKRFHRSNLYSNAPMPYMQRLTWDGIAIHAGQLPGYPASHGCIRIPDAFARELFAITGPASTAVIVVDEALTNEADALALAQRTEALVPISPELLKREQPALAKADAVPPVAPVPSPAPPPTERLPAVREILAPRSAESILSMSPLPVEMQQTIQLAATLSPELAAAQWDELSARTPALRLMRMAIIPAVVNGTKYYRLRVSSKDAHAICRALKREGIACFPVS
jgi:hypothetical protein